MKKINLTEYIQKTAENVRLTTDERERMKRVLSEYVAMKPLRVAPLDRRAPLSYALISFYALSRKSIAGILVAVLLFSGAGVSFAAENALPGDVLYPIKVEVNEPVVAALSVSQESKVLWNAERAERRLEEAALLASNGTLTEAKKQELEDRFDRYAERVIAEVEQIEESNSSVAVDIASQFENKLLAHETVLSDFEAGDNVKRLKENVRTRVERLAFVRERAGFTPPPAPPVSAAVAIADVPSVSTFSAPESARALMAEAPPQPAPLMKRETISEEQLSIAASPAEGPSLNSDIVKRIAHRVVDELKECKKLFDRNKVKMDVETSASVADKIRLAETQIAEADAAFAVGDLSTAFEMYRNASASATKLTVAMKAFAKSKIRIVKPLNDGQQNTDDDTPDSDTSARLDDEDKLEKTSSDSKRLSDD